MAAPTISLPVSGTAPNQYTTKEQLETVMNAAFAELDAATNAGLSEKASQSDVAGLSLKNAAVETKVAGALPADDLVPLERNSQRGVGEDLLEVRDYDDRVVLRIDEAGRLYLPGYELSLQNTISHGGGGLIVCMDAQGYTTLAQDPDTGDLLLPGLDTSVQVGIRAASMHAAPILDRRPHERVIGPELAILCAAVGCTGVSPPLHLYPAQWSPGVAWVDELEVSTPAYTPIDTPYGPDFPVVHPSVLEFWGGFRGYRYILGVTPYLNSGEEFENPVLYGSNDLHTFELLDGFEQPLAHRPDVAAGQTGHLSDIALAHDPRTGELVCVWRQTLRLDGDGSESSRIVDSLHYRTTRDGYSWTPAREIISGPRSVDIFLSPSIIFDPATFTWHMYTARSGRVRHRTSGSLTGPWSDFDEITLPGSLYAWHIDVRYVGDQLVMLVHDWNEDNLFFGVASNWSNWVFSSNYFLSGHDGSVYKATFVPEMVGDDQMQLTVLWTDDASLEDTTKWWRLRVAKSNIIDI